MEKERTNPFFSEFKTPHQTVPFGEIEEGDYLPAFNEAITQGKAEVQAIIDNPDAPTFENTIVALEQSGELLNTVAGVFYNLLSAETTDSLQAIAQEVSPMLTNYNNDINLNADLFAKVKAVYGQKESLSLTTEQATLLENTYVGFTRSGANLSETDKETFRTISTELSKLSLDFGNNVLAETNAYELHITDSTQLTGLTGDIMETAAAKAKSKGKEEGWLFDISMPSYLPFMKNADNRELRKEMYIAYSSKGAKNNEYNNEDKVRRIVELRLQMANLLGYETYADYVLTRRMAKNPAGVYQLLDDLYDASMTLAKAEMAELNAFAKANGFEGEKVQPWDYAYYSEKLKDEKYALNDEMLKPYFELSNVEKGVFGLATDLYGITFVENKEIPVYHEEVKAYDVLDADGSFLAVFYTDFHPRAGKRGGAWMNSIKDQYIKDGVNVRPHIMIVMNFTRPTETKPALLTFNEVETFLHEFGHALHGMFANSSYSSISGTSVYRDFVELPSQIMENWAVEKDFLDKFAVHYKTGEKIPAGLVEKIITSKNYMAGYASVRQLSFGYLDMAWHSTRHPITEDVKQFEETAWAKTQLFDAVPGCIMSTQFGHLFAGGYAAGYYGYKWAEVLDADAFSMFQQNGLFDKATAASFRKNILEKGGSEDPMTLYVRFRGQAPTTDALLKRSGM